MYETALALVLRAVHYKESGLILTVLSAERGKITVSARGASRKNSPLAAATQVLSYSKMTLFVKGDRYYLHEAEPVEVFAGLRADIERMALAGWFIDLADTLSVEDVATPELLALTLGALHAVSSGRYSPAHVKAAFEMRLMALSGFGPGLEACAVCGEEEIDHPALDLEEGMLLCGACADGEDVTVISAATLAALRHTLYREPKKLYAFTLDEASAAEFGQVAERFLRTHLDGEFPALKFYHSVRTQ